MTYDDLTKTTGYKELISAGLVDKTGPIQKKRMSMRFHTPDDRTSYVVYQYGRISRGTSSFAGEGYKMNPMKAIGPLNTPDDYNRGFKIVLNNFKGVRAKPRRGDEAKLEYLRENKTILFDIIFRKEEGYEYPLKHAQRNYKDRSLVTQLYYATKTIAL